jgi:hypothetical protein
LEPIKKGAINIVTNLPDDADMEEIKYRRGQEDAEKRQN